MVSPSVSAKSISEMLISTHHIRDKKVRLMLPSCHQSRCYLAHIDLLLITAFHQKWVFFSLLTNSPSGLHWCLTVDSCLIGQGEIWSLAKKSPSETNKMERKEGRKSICYCWAVGNPRKSVRGSTLQLHCAQIIGLEGTSRMQLVHRAIFMSSKQTTTDW